MDRIKYFVWGCLLAFLYVGCVDEDFIEADRGEIRVTGTLANADTRIVYAEHETVVSSVWKVRDAIGLSSSKQSNLKYVALSEGAETDFVASSADSLLQAGEGEEVYAYYPFTTLHTKYEVFGEDNSTVSLPELYFQYRSKGLGSYDFIYAVGKQANNTCSLQFKHLFTFLKLEVKAGLIKEPGEWGQGWQYRGLMIKSSEPLNYIVQYTDPVSFTPAPKFSVAQQKMFVEKYKDGDGWRDAYASNDIFYIMDEDSIPADSVITCYVAMLPQSEKAYVRVYDMATEQCLFEGKPVPKGGLKSGCMYSLSLDTLDTPTRDAMPMSMEELGQDYGYVLYSTTISRGKDIWHCKIRGGADRAIIFADRKQVDIRNDYEMDRKTGFTLENESGKLDILVENMGRVNYGPEIEFQKKGITHGVQINGTFHMGWDMYRLPLNDISKVDFTRSYTEGLPAFYKFTFDVEEAGDTFLDVAGFGKGCAFVNGKNIGRFWEAGPQKRLYIPGPLLEEGTNEIILFETDGKASDTISLTDTPDLG